MDLDNFFLAVFWEFCYSRFLLRNEFLTREAYYNLQMLRWLK
jgi:hypothetical protein